VRLPDLVAHARSVLGSSPVAVASVATSFPSGRASLKVKLMDVRDAVSAGADEIDMVIDRGAFLSGRIGQVFDEVVAVKEACGEAHLKVISKQGSWSRTTTSDEPVGSQCSAVPISSRPQRAK